MTFDYRSQYREYRKYIEGLKQKVKTPTAQVSLAVVGTILFAAFLAAAALRPTLVIIASLVRDINLERQTIEALDRKIRALQVAQQRLERTQHLMGPATVAIPGELDADVFIKEIELLAFEHQLKLLTVDQREFMLYAEKSIASSNDEPLSIQSIPASLTIGGSEQSIREFLADLERLDRLVVVGSVQVTSVPPGNRQDRPYAVNATVVMSIYTSQHVLDQKRPVQKPTNDSL